jgi:hypothetical protein
LQFAGADRGLHETFLQIAGDDCGLLETFLQIAGDDRGLLETFLQIAGEKCVFFGAVSQRRPGKQKEPHMPKTCCSLMGFLKKFVYTRARV